MSFASQKKGIPVLVLSIAGAFAWACSSDSTDSGLGGGSDGGADGPTAGGGQGAGGGSGNGGGSSTSGGRTGGGGAGVTGGQPGGGGSDAGAGGGTGGAGPTSCSSDGDCTGTLSRCSPTSRTCVECLFNNECAGGTQCTDEVCSPLLPCANSRDCRAAGGPRTICDSATLVCVECAEDVDCGDRRVCAGTVCVDASACATDVDCLLPDGAVPPGGGAQCSSQTGRCVECTEDVDCGVDGHCVGEVCRTGCASDNDCPGIQLCDDVTDACVDCRNDGECGALEFCQTGTCTPDVCAQGVKSCQLNFVIECTANGDGVLAPVPCDQTEQCVAIGTDATCQALPPPDGGTVPTLCSDRVKNGDETDVDCGGACDPCGEGSPCVDADDCASSVCTASCTGLFCFPGTRDLECRPASCSDQATNGTETDLNCGGDACPRCDVGEVCAVAADCASNVCTGNLCAVAECSPRACAACPLLQSACCTRSGACGCATTFPFPGACQATP